MTKSKGVGDPVDWKERCAAAERACQSLKKQADEDKEMRVAAEDDLHKCEEARRKELAEMAGTITEQSPSLWLSMIVMVMAVLFITASLYCLVLRTRLVALSELNGAANASNAALQDALAKARAKRPADVKPLLYKAMQSLEEGRLGDTEDLIQAAIRKAGGKP